MLTDQTFIRGYARGQQYLPIGRRDLFVFRAELGGVFTSGSSAGVPASLLFRAGGSNSVRGYGYQSIGNNVDGSVLPTKYSATGTAEYQHQLNHAVGAATFFDIGTATDAWGERVFYPGVGIGARWRSPRRPDQRRRGRIRAAQPQRAPVPDARHRFLTSQPDPRRTA